MTPPPDPQGIRKAAIFVASLDRKTADLILDQMQEPMAQAVRQAILELDAIDPEEQRAVVADFRRRRLPTKSGERASPSEVRRGSGLRMPGVEVDIELAKKFAPPPLDRPTPPPSEPAPPTGPPFRFLREAEADKLARVLAVERPQTIALVLAHLPPQHAGSVLARLEAPLQVEVLRRLVDLEETDPEILREVERGLEIRLSKQVPMQRRRVAGMAAVAGILEACDRRTGDRILDNLDLYDRDLAERLKPAEFAFDDLLTLDDASLGAALRAADAEWIQLALVGAPPEWIQRFLDLLPDSTGRQIRHELDHLGPTRLSDVEEARARLAGLAQRLAAQGRIRVPYRTMASGNDPGFRGSADVGNLSLAGV